MTPSQLTNPLTQEERDVLKHSARGLSPREVGQVLEMRTAEVCHHRHEYIQKLNANTPEHAIALACCYDILTSEQIL